MAYTTVQAIATRLLMTGFNGNTEAEVRKHIESEYRSYFSSFRDRNIDGAMSVLDDGFIWKSGEQILDRQQTREAIVEQLSGLVSVDDMNMSIKQLDVVGNQAVVLGIETLVSTAKTEQGVLTQSTTKETYRDLWVKISAGWKLRTSELLDD
jgi:hypothetical protein